MLNNMQTRIEFKILMFMKSV